MARGDDRSEKHLEWLVTNRCANQRVTLKLYNILTENEDIIGIKPTYAQLALELAGAAFSLWRAVFLSDLTGESAEQIVDVKTFLGSLISNNAIGYPQDRNAREWTFEYYLSDARFRLISVATRPPQVIAMRDVDVVARSAKGDWEIMHQALEKAIDAFAILARQPI